MGKLRADFGRAGTAEVELIMPRRPHSAAETVDMTLPKNRKPWAPVTRRLPMEDVDTFHLYRSPPSENSVAAEQAQPTPVSPDHRPARCRTPSTSRAIRLRVATGLGRLQHGRKGTRSSSHQVRCALLGSGKCRRTLRPRRVLHHERRHPYPRSTSGPCRRQALRPWPTWRCVDKLPPPCSALAKTPAPELLPVHEPSAEPDPWPSTRKGGPAGSSGRPQ